MRTSTTRTIFPFPIDGGKCGQSPGLSTIVPREPPSSVLDAIVIIILRLPVANTTWILDPDPDFQLPNVCSGWCSEGETCYQGAHHLDSIGSVSPKAYYVADKIFVDIAFNGLKTVGRFEPPALTSHFMPYAIDGEGFDGEGFDGEGFCSVAAVLVAWKRRIVVNASI